MTAGPASPESFELVLFDCDGVLVDSEKISVLVDQRVLADLGWELELDEMCLRRRSGSPGPAPPCSPRCASSRT